MTALIEDAEACEVAAALATALDASDVDLPVTITFEPPPSEGENR